MTDKILRVVTVLFKKNATGKPLFLLLHRCLNWKGWELLKGQIEANESLEDAASREIFEETGLSKSRIVKQLKQKMTFFDKVRGKPSEVFAFLVEALDDSPISFDNNPVREHDNFEWVPADLVVKKLKFENTRELFLSALAELDDLA